jgi:hypothetical protein
VLVLYWNTSPSFAHWLCIRGRCVAHKTCNATQRNATQRNATQRNATQRNATQRNATQRNATQRNATQRNATQRNVLSCVALRKTSRCVALRCVALQVLCFRVACEHEHSLRCNTSPACSWDPLQHKSSILIATQVQHTPDVCVWDLLQHKSSILATRTLSTLACCRCGRDSLRASGRQNTTSCNAPLISCPPSLKRLGAKL